MYPLQRRAVSRSNGYRNFQEAFIATLALLGHKTVVWRDNEHHRRFHCAMTRLRELQSQGVPGAEQLPRAMHPTAVNGFYRDIQNALMMQLLVRIEMPSDGVAEIMLDDRKAKAILNEDLEVSSEAQAVLRLIAEAFSAPLPTQAAR